MDRKIVKMVLEGWDSGLIGGKTINEVIDFLEELKENYYSGECRFEQTHSANQYSASVETLLTGERFESDVEYEIRMEERRVKLSKVEKRVHKYSKQGERR